MIVTRVKQILFNGGFDEPVFLNYMEDIARQNDRMVKTTSLIGCIMMFVLTLAAQFVSSIGRVLPLYLITAILFGSIYAVVRFVPGRSNAVTILCNYAFLLVAFFFALALDAIQSNPTATTVCVLLVALPLLIVDKPIREITFFVTVSICFMLESVYLKKSPKASIDVVNAASFLGIGTFLGYKHNQMVLRNIRGQHQLQYQRDTDPLTKLYNKKAFENLACAYMEQNDGKVSVMVIDMDNFKYVNDTYGHQAGDEILSKVGTVLAAQFKSGDYVCRFGGDEFVAFLPETADKEALRRIAETILAGVSQLRITADESYRAHLCIGIATYPEDGRDFDELFRNADDALYQVKRNGKNGYDFYDVRFKTKILVVDDIEMNRAILKKILSADHEVLEAEDGSEALAVLEASAGITMVITDIQMPGMDGIELIRHIRSEDRWRDIAIIANTQFGDRKQDEQVIRLGADDFIYKAASPGVVQKRVRNVLKARNL